MSSCRSWKPSYGLSPSVWAPSSSLILREGQPSQDRLEGRQRRRERDARYRAAPGAPSAVDLHGESVSTEANKESRTEREGEGTHHPSAVAAGPVGDEQLVRQRAPLPPLGLLVRVVAEVLERAAGELRHSETERPQERGEEGVDSVRMRLSQLDSVLVGTLIGVGRDAREAEGALALQDDPVERARRLGHVGEGRREPDRRARPVPLLLWDMQRRRVLGDLLEVRDEDAGEEVERGRLVDEGAREGEAVEVLLGLLVRELVLDPGVQWPAVCHRARCLTTRRAGSRRVEWGSELDDVEARLAGARVGRGGLQEHTSAAEHQARGA